MTVLNTDAIHLNAQDNIAVAMRDLPAGETITVAERQYTLSSPVKLGHKIAITAINEGEQVYKYGQIIGLATKSIAPGDHVHSHNTAQGNWEKDFAPASDLPAPPEPITNATFEGYRRADGKVGTRNYVAVISTVNCSATVAREIAQRFNSDLLKDYPNIDGVISIRHASGCGMQYAGLKHQYLNRVLGGMARHPNIGAYLLVGLGCEQGAMGYLLQDQNLVQISGMQTESSGKPIVMSIQDSGGTTRTIEQGINTLAEVLPKANAVQRETCPASEIILGTECGGSDGNSGVTANPALGNAVDRLVACGGTSILAETPEIYGAEHLLTRRARSVDVAKKLMDRIAWWQWYTGMYGVELDNNPSVGNKEGGLTTIAEKSLGAVAKGGTTALEAVYEYAEPVTSNGLVFMDTPGFDPPSVTGMVAGGANVVVFTTGRGSCFGCKPTPSIKLATNTPMFERMQEDMDLNAGPILTGTPMQEVGEMIFREILEVASGKKTKSEHLGLGDEEFVPWLPGPTL